MKAILVIDMPKFDEETKNGCRNCRYARKRMTLSEEYLCSITEQAAYVYDMKCPLKPMPQRKMVGEIKEVDDFMKSEMQIINDKVTAQIMLDTELLIASGYNLCIDEILGEEE